MQNITNKTTSNNIFNNLKLGVEDIYSDKVDEERLLRIIKDFKINLSDFFKNTTDINEDNKRRFNEILSICRNKYGYNMFDVIIVVEREYISFNKIIDILSDENKALLSSEMTEAFKIKTNDIKKKKAIKKVMMSI